MAPDKKYQADLDVLAAKLDSLHTSLSEHKDTSAASFAEIKSSVKDLENKIITKSEHQITCQMTQQRIGVIEKLVYGVAGIGASVVIGYILTVVLTSSKHV